MSRGHAGRSEARGCGCISRAGLHRVASHLASPPGAGTGAGRSRTRWSRGAGRFEYNATLLQSALGPSGCGWKDEGPSPAGKRQIFTHPAQFRQISVGSRPCAGELSYIVTHLNL